MLSKQLLIALLLLLSGVVALDVSAKEYTSCDGGALTLNNVDFGKSSFSLPANCAVSIDGGSASTLLFRTALANVALSIRNLDCGAVASPGDDSISDCIVFLGRLEGATRISIDGVQREWSGESSSAVGHYHVIRFASSVCALSIHIRNVEVTVRLKAALHFLHLVFFTDAVTGHSVSAIDETSDRNLALRCINISGNRMIGAVASTGGYASAHMVRFNSAVSGFDAMEVSSNTLSLGGWSDAKRVVPSADTVLVWFLSTVAFTSAPTSSFSMRNNVMDDNTVLTVGSVFARLSLACFDKPVSGASAFTVDVLTMLRSNVTAKDSFARFAAVVFAPQATLTMAGGSSAISISGVSMSGNVTYSQLGAEANDAPFGARVVEFNALRSASTLTVSSCSLDVDMATTAPAVHVVAVMVSFNVRISSFTRLSVQKCALSGNYSAAGASANTELNVLRFLGSVTNTAKIQATGNIIAANASASDGHVEVFGAVFESFAAGTQGNSDWFEMTHLKVTGYYESHPQRHVCVGNAAVSNEGARTGFESMSAAGTQLQYTASGGGGGAESRWSESGFNSRCDAVAAREERIEKSTSRCQGAASPACSLQVQCGSFPAVKQMTTEDEQQQPTTSRDDDEAVAITESP